jgi:phosphoglycerate dehydrogenase-like enzyme
MSNVELQCHIGGGTVDSHMGFERMGIENILAYMKTGKAISPVNMHSLKSE